MAYTDYAFYKNEYHGDVVPETDFPKYADRASDRVDEITFDRLADGLSSDSRANKKVQKAVCSVAEALYQIDSVKKRFNKSLHSCCSPFLVLSFDVSVTGTAGCRIGSQATLSP